MDKVISLEYLYVKRDLCLYSYVEFWVGMRQRDFNQLQINVRGLVTTNEQIFFIFTLQEQKRT